MMAAIHVMTGATSGLGLEVARRLAEKTRDEIVAGARNPANAVDLKQVVPAGQLVPLRLDTASPDLVKAFASEVRQRLGGRKIASLSCIAGLQILGPQKLTADGLDETFATNVAGHLLLADELSEHLEPGAVVITIGSGTHDPANKLARHAGFAGADFTSAAAAMRGESTRPERDERARALDRYATSKLCAIYHATAAATEPAFADVRFYCFDPGLMPGTGLARQQNAAVRFVWKRIMPLLAGFAEGVSTPDRSARFLVDHLILGPREYPSGGHIEFTGKPAPASNEANDLSIAKRFLKEARAMP
ncbi:SDR family NAD(P)-dependent oxidoreductase [Hoeflea ulvae]|uniref:SDR family NAD(P)-dependent oxidoreductase n=1 Tax=Hoeflea ulvae TaxID=2983764 RepID=A0ABT3YJB4_9HYPH|nr:SDR family NAD(P)-dependent oxidoreductase [Hoeflea ulvae]MCY0095995.1 SDR family NAD(P)-dependent oxidoreductase [Hoeflea ulvae]